MTNSDPVHLEQFPFEATREPWRLSLEVILVVSGFLSFVVLFAITVNQLQGIVS